MLSTWNSADPFSMKQVIDTCGMPLEDDELRLIRKLTEGYGIASVYDLHEMNVLCFMSVGRPWYH